MLQDTCLILGIVICQAGDKPDLVAPIMLERPTLLAGNPLATYGAMLEREKDYLQSPIAGLYREMRFNLEEFLGVPDAGVKAMQLPTLRGQDHNDEDRELPVELRPGQQWR